MRVEVVMGGGAEVNAEEVYSRRGSGRSGRKKKEKGREVTEFIEENRTS